MAIYTIIIIMTPISYIYILYYNKLISVCCTHSFLCWINNNIIIIIVLLYYGHIYCTV